MKTIVLPSNQATQEDTITAITQTLAGLNDFFTIGTEEGETDRLYFTGCSEKFYIKIESNSKRLVMNFYNPLNVKIGHGSSGIGGQDPYYTEGIFFSYHKTAQGSFLFGFWNQNFPSGGINAALIVPEETGQHWIGMTYEASHPYISLENLTLQYVDVDALPYTRPLDLNISNVVIGKALWEKFDIVFDNLYMVYRGGMKATGGLRSAVINGKKYAGFILKETAAYNTNYTTFFVLDDETLI